jgi:thiosulfate/3-mercaptopyruvate sulfurtransferase
MKNIRFLAWQYITALFVVSAVLVAVPIVAQEQASKLVSTDWLKDNLTKENVRIVDIRERVTDYWQAHIPGAVYFNPEAMRLADDGVPVKLMPPEALTIMLGKMGIDQKTMVVVYGEQGDFKAPYLIWALDYIEHPYSAILEGGFTKWKKDENPVTQDYPKIKPTNYPLPSEVNDQVRASLEEVKKVVTQGGAVLFDVRPAEMYTGEKGFWKRKGHIKGAINHFWGEDLKEDGTWKSKEELKQTYEKLGATPDKLVILSCGQGQMSAHSYFTLKHILGYPNVKNYDGSFNEWSNFDELPVETGSGKPSLGSEGLTMTGKDLVQDRCTKCHDQSRINRAKKDQPGWEKLVDKMIHNGAKLSATERQTVINYLSNR